MGLWQSGIGQFVIFVLALIVTLTFHEASHALVAYYLGDPTAKIRGRLTLNPIAHLDAVGSIVFLITQSIGWGKPVPVNPGNFRHPVRDNALTALAGPISNFLLAFVIALPLKYLFPHLNSGNEFLQAVKELFQMLLWMIFNVSIFLGIFNLFPLPPLDGSKIVGLLIPSRWVNGYEKFLQNGVKYFIAIILIDVFVLEKLLGFSVFGSIMMFLYEKVRFLLLLGT